MVTASPESAILPEFETAQGPQQSFHRVVPAFRRPRGKLKLVVEHRTLEQVPRQLFQILAAVLARYAAGQDERIWPQRGGEHEGIDERRANMVAQNREAGRHRSGQRLLHLGIVGGAPRFAVDLEAGIQQACRSLFQMRKLLQPEAHGAKPLLARRGAFGDLETILDLKIGEMCLDHAEHRAAVLFRGDQTAQPQHRAAARCRPDIGLLLGLGACVLSGVRRRLGEDGRRSVGGIRAGECAKRRDQCQGQDRALIEPGHARRGCAPSEDCGVPAQQESLPWS